MPDQVEVVRELLKRRDQLPPDKVAVVDELAKRFNLASPSAGAPVVKAEKSLKEFGSNVLDSGANFVKDTVNAVAHPLQTLDGLGAIPVGIYEKLGGQGLDGSSAKMFDGMLEHFAKRYGTHEARTEALYKDPIGVLADLSTLAGIGGGSLKLASVGTKAAGAAKVASGLERAAKVAGTISAATDPVGMTGRVLAPATRALKVPERMYQSALKPSQVHTPDTVKGMIRTGLENGFPISEKGLEQIWQHITDLNTQVTDKVKDAAQRGVSVDSNAVASRVDQIRSKFESVNQRQDLKRLDKAKVEFLEDHGGMTHGTPGTPPQATGVLRPNGQPVMSPGTPGTPGKAPGAIPVDRAQQLKVNTYRKHREAYGEFAEAEIEAQKALARGIAEEIALALPEVASLTAKEAASLGLAPAIEKAVRRGGNANLVSLGTPAVGGAVAEMSGNGKAGIVAAAMRSVIDMPVVKSRLAVAINRAQQRNPQKFGRPSVATAMSRVEAYLTSLQERAQNGTGSGFLSPATLPAQ